MALSILVFGIFGAGMTIGVYSQHVYSTHEAQIITGEGTIAALYPQRLSKKIAPHQIAKVTFQGQASLLPCKAEVISVNPTMLGRRSLLLVKLQLLDGTTRNNGLQWEKQEVLVPGTHCTVTIDTTIPPIH
ncbi:MAG: hypothetical protein K9M81_00225 [Chthoniobacterales bacterium]|nr:hypothetical protein [Chthoniobacterales bacterium]